MKSCTPAIPRWFPKKILFGFFILEKQLASQNLFLEKIQTFSYNISLSCFLFQHRNRYSEGMVTDRKLHVDTLIFIPTWKTTSFHIPENFLVNTLLLYIPLLTLTDGETHTLALCGLEEPAHALHGLEKLFFQLCCCVSFWFWREIGFGFTYLRMLLNIFFGTNILLIVVKVLRYFVHQFR